MKRLLILLALIASPVSGQTYGDVEAAFAGVTAVDARVFVTWDDRITKWLERDGRGPGKTEAQFSQEIETAFQLGVLRAGVRLDAAAPNYLWCSVNVIDSETGLVAYNTNVNFRELIGGRSFQTWDRSNVGTIGALNLNGRSYGTWCAEQFEIAYRTANPGR